LYPALAGLQGWKREKFLSSVPVSTRFVDRGVIDT
jgi:hypothetical protein